MVPPSPVSPFGACDEVTTVDAGEEEKQAPLRLPPRSLPLVPVRVRAPISVDVGQVAVVPVEVSASVEPSLGACMRVGARLEPPAGGSREGQ